MYGFRMATDESDQLAAWFMFRAAIGRRCPVRVSFFKRKKDARRRPMADQYGNPVFVKVTRTVEPFELGTTVKGERFVRVVDRSPEGEDHAPEYRMIKLASVAVSYRTKRPMVTPLWSYGFLCPSPLDGQELHPRKGALAQSKVGILLAPCQ